MKIELTPIGYVKNSRKDISDDFWGEVVSEIELTEKLNQIREKKKMIESLPTMPNQF